MSAGEQTGVAGGAGSGAEGGAGPDLVRQMARDLAEDDVHCSAAGSGGAYAT